MTQHKDRSASWLRTAMLALGLLAIIAAIVSYQAQYLMVVAYKHVKFIAALQAGIPDVAAMVFAALGIALALHGKRAIRARILNVAAVGTSITMNLLASGHGWKALSIWALAPVSYAVTSDTLIGVVRSHAVALQKQLDTGLDDDETTPLAVLGKALLYSARLVLAPPSTLVGVRRAVLQAAPLPGYVNSYADDDEDLYQTDYADPADPTRPSINRAWPQPEIEGSRASGTVAADRPRSSHTHRRAKRYLSRKPEMTGEELGAKLGVSGRQGRRIKNAIQGVVEDAA